VTELTLETLRTELAPITAELISIVRRLGAIEPLGGCPSSRGVFGTNLIPFEA
jgi:hypothetical protein